jgi:hypothetical protein
MRSLVIDKQAKVSFCVQRYLLSVLKRSWDSHMQMSIIMLVDFVTFSLICTFLLAVIWPLV